MKWHVIAGLAVITWLAPIDYRDDGSPGRCVLYDVRMSTAPITQYNFGTAQRLGGAPLPGPPGSKQFMVVENLEAGRWYWFALRTADESGNWSGVSNVAKKQAKVASLWKLGHAISGAVKKLVRS